MNEQPPEPISFSQAEVAEELALQEALKRTRLEEAAQSPTLSRLSWPIYIVIGGLLLFFQDHLSDHLWLIVIFLLIQIHLASNSVHSRIDALLDLERLEDSAPLSKMNKDANAHRDRSVEED